MNFAEIGHSMIKALTPFPCRCGGTFNQSRTKGKGFPVVLIYECSDCKRETEQTMDVPSLDELTPEQKAEILEIGKSELAVKMMRAATKLKKKQDEL